MRLFLVFFLTSCSMYSSVFEHIEKRAPYYFDDIFTNRLYSLEKTNDYDHTEQKDMPLSESSEQKLDRLKKRKQFRVAKTLLKELDAWQEHLSQGSWDKAIEGLGRGAISAITMGGALKYFVKGTDANSTTICLVGACTIAVFECAWQYLFSNKEQNMKISLLKNTILQKLDQEPIKEAEELYIRCQIELPKDAKDAIETCLLNARKQPISTSFGSGPIPLEFVKEIIALPRGLISLPPKAAFTCAGDYRTSRQQFIERIFPSKSSGSESPEKKLRLDSSFYTPEVKERLKSLLGKFCDDAYTQYPSLKGVIFYGCPGAGKTKAAELIAENLELPFYKISIKGNKDIDDKKLYGNAANSFKPGNRGVLAEAFLTTNRQGNTAKNLIILLDDIDRAFDDEVEGLMTFMLDFLDINKTTIKSAYYGLKLDFSHVIIIATMNKDIREEKQFDALKSRCEFIDFGKPSKDLLKQSLVDYVDDAWLSISDVFADRKDEWGAIKQKIAGFIIDSYDIDDNRQRQARVRELAATSEEQWTELAKARCWEYTGTSH
jgi:hypothetical protein